VDEDCYDTVGDPCVCDPDSEGNCLEDDEVEAGDTGIIIDASDILFFGGFINHLPEELRVFINSNETLKNEIRDFLILNEFSDASETEATMRLQVEIIQPADWDFTDTGTYLARSSLNYVATYELASAERMYLLENGTVLFATQGIRAINDEDLLSYAANEEDVYHYVYNYDEDRWYEYMLPTINYSCLSCDIDLFFRATLENGGILLGRYIFPVEDVLILVTGRDFDGIEQSRAVAAGFLLIDIIPGATFVRALRGARFSDEVVDFAHTVIKIADDTFKLQKEIFDDVIAGIIDLDLYGNTIRKGNFGEIATDVSLYSKGYTPLHVRIDDIDKPLSTGIDGIFQNPSTGEFLIVESKFGSGVLGLTADGLQMSDTWILGSDRLINEVGPDLANEIILRGYRRILSNVASDGVVVYRELNSSGGIVGSWVF